MSGKCHKMDPEAKAVWVKALRSNKYKQCRDHLARHNSDGTDSYCALGVLMNELGTGDWELSRSLAGVAFWEYVEEGRKFSSYFRLTPEFCGLIHESERETISILNDEGHKSFAEIADWIEENL